MPSPQNSQPIPLSHVARLPSPRDNCALACAPIPTGTQLLLEDGTLITLKDPILEGHRFPLATAPEGTLLTSWDLPFGRAVRDIAPGEALYNRTALDALAVRFPDRRFPSNPNFENHAASFEWDRNTYSPAPAPHPMESPGSFMGFDRGADRGSGTRNFLVVLGTNSLSAPLVQRLVETLRPSTHPTAGFDGVVPVTHTEGGGDTEPNNAELILRALAGWVVHPNVGAVVAIDVPRQPIDNERLHGFLTTEGYPEEPSRLAYYSLTGDTDVDIAQTSALTQSFVAQLSEQTRTPRPMKHLKIALQCGGSDAFSGLSGNPLAGWVAKELIAHGGSANLAETSELIGAESYVLAKTKSAAVVERFLWIRDRFERWAAWHGHSAEGNPSGGNIIRGLYNITIKSIGAANKKHPDTRLDAVLEYGEPMTEPGFYFMDSPGNDLESIAGQVASGCNLILFITGNGSITNFPFVPTLKIVTTTDRYHLLSEEMDVNAGRYQDGESMEALGAQTFELAQRVASGERTCGERAGHSQVQIWRDWKQGDDSALPSFANPLETSGVGLKSKGVASNDANARAAKALLEAAQQRIRLIAPASLCSGQIARIAADQLNQSNKDSTVRYLALDHTEGCGVSRGPSEDLFVRIMLHYALHPLVESCLFLEHGCEKTHNGEFRQALLELGERPEAFGWASVQLDGGATKVTDRIGEWFQATPARRERQPRPVIAFLGQSDNDAGNPESFATILTALLAAGISPLFGHRDTGLSQIADWIDGDIAVPTLAHGEAPQTLGIHIMDMPTTRYEEQLTGLCAGGAMAVVRASESPASWNNPLVPHIDLRFRDSTAETLRMWADQLGAHNQAQEPRSLQTFQITRAERGFSL